jgi:hypothetical protein
MNKTFASLLCVAASMAGLNHTTGATASGYHFAREDDALTANGIISRWPIIESGEWDDPLTATRDFVWARSDVPGPKDLWAVRMHLLMGWRNERSSPLRVTKREAVCTDAGIHASSHIAKPREPPPAATAYLQGGASPSYPPCQPPPVEGNGGSNIPSTRWPPRKGGRRGRGWGSRSITCRG